ncbi:MAG: hypothetical protein HYT99_04250, partial [Candidatus Tectomicrobia bacterium]|nr:hypothetical protein [Candidatus Tectomicrobia bacterium]
MRKPLLPALGLCGIFALSPHAYAASCSSFADSSGNFIITQDCTGTVTATQSGASLLNSATLAGGVFAGNGIRFDVTNASGGIIRRSALTPNFAVELRGGGALTNSGTIGDGLTGIDSNGKVLIITSLSSPGVLTNNLGSTILGGAALSGDAATVVNRGTISYNIAGASGVGVVLSGANASLINSGLIVSGPVTSYGVTSGDFGGANYTNESGGRIEG